MKIYKICLQCLNDLQDIESRKAMVHRHHCEQKPRCFDQPERSKREDLEKCTDINHGQNDRMEFFVVCQPHTQDEKRCSECIKFCIGCNGKRF